MHKIKQYYDLAQLKEIFSDVLLRIVLYYQSLIGVVISTTVFRYRRICKITTHCIHKTLQLIVFVPNQIKHHRARCLNRFN